MAKEAILRAKYIMDKDCIFCKIVAGEIKTKPLYESETVLAFSDINPVSEVHLLIIPKRHIESVMTIDQEDAADVIDMHIAAQKLVSDMKLDAFRLAFNGGRFAHVPHLHMHLIAGKKIDWKKL